MNKMARQPLTSVKCKKTRQRRDNPPQTKTGQPSTSIKMRKTRQPQTTINDTDTKNVSKPSTSKRVRDNALEV